MCLYTKSNIPNIAQEDIKCFKIYIKALKNNEISLWNRDLPVIKNEIYTPFGGMLVNLDDDFIKVDYNRDEFPFDDCYRNYYVINDELIHSFQYDVNLYIWDFPINKTIEYILCKCVIPKGADYYICLMENVYASNEIKIISKMTFNNIIEIKNYIKK